MKGNAFLATVLALSVSLASSSLFGREVAESKSGEALFKEHCAACHSGGGNILNPQKTLYRKDREANNISTAADIIRKMRNPGPFPTHPQEWAGMKMFDEKTISNEDAQKIADYILQTFNK